MNQIRTIFYQLFSTVSCNILGECCWLSKSWTAGLSGFCLPVAGAKVVQAPRASVFCSCQRTRRCHGKQQTYCDDLVMHADMGVCQTDLSCLGNPHSSSQPTMSGQEPKYTLAFIEAKLSICRSAGRCEVVLFLVVIMGICYSCGFSCGCKCSAFPVESQVVYHRVLGSYNLRFLLHPD